MQISYSARAPKPEAAAWSFVADPVALATQSDVLFVTLAATGEQPNDYELAKLQNALSKVEASPAATRAS
jgi:lactate dehydrogenase-like 2-hydroxyacid dehydrogenase